MIKLLRKLLSRPAPVVALKGMRPKRFTLCPDDDFGRRWHELLENGGLPHNMTEAKLIECLISFHNASVQEREYELRYLLHYISLTELRTLSTRWWGIVARTSWVQLSSQQLQQLKPYPSSFRRRAVMAYQNLRLACGILALHLHLHQREAMGELAFFIVQCEESIPRLGKASPYLAKAARRLQRSYGILPHFGGSVRTKPLPGSGGSSMSSRFDELAKLIAGGEGGE